MISIQQIRFILGECPSGWLNAGELGGCYLFSPDGPGINWDQARDFCESVGGFLADILNQETQDFIDDSGFFQSYPNVNWWIGANDIANVSHAIIKTRCLLATIADSNQSMTEAVFLTLGRSRSSHFKKLGLRPKT